MLQPNTAVCCSHAHAQQCLTLQLAPQRQISHGQVVANDVGAQRQVIIDAVADGLKVGTRHDVVAGILQPVVDLHEGQVRACEYKRSKAVPQQAAAKTTSDELAWVAPSASVPYSLSDASAERAM